MVRPISWIALIIIFGLVSITQNQLIGDKHFKEFKNETLGVRDGSVNIL